MSDRELLTECLEALTHDAAQRTFAGGVRMSQLAIKLRAHLAAPEPEPGRERAEVAPPARGVGQLEEIDSFTPEVYHEKRHPGYVIGNHWLETAYERLCAGETEDAILEDYEVAREPRLRELRRDAERYRWLRQERYMFREGAVVSCDTQSEIAALWVKCPVTNDATEVDAAIDAAIKGDKTCA